NHMAEQTHTPGPWKSEYHGKESHAIIGGSANGRDWTIIAEIHDPVGYVPRSERSANARLIAAAPDLLAACKAVLNEIQTNTEWLDPAVESALEAAIAKATGK